MTKLGAVLLCKCPRCREGKLYEYGPLNLSKLARMPKYCPVCGLKYEREHGFFWGAMYISYALNVGLLVGLGLMMNWFFGVKDTEVFIGVILPVVILAFPFVFRYSRVLLLHFFAGLSYMPGYKEDREESASKAA